MVDVVVVGGYLGLMLVVGWRSRHQTADSFWVAGRRYTAGPITASLVATIFGASSTMGVIGLAYTRGLTGVWWSLVGGMALVPFGLFLAKRVRALDVYTLPDILKNAYGLRVSVPAALMIAIAWCGVVAAQMVAGARLLSGLFPLGFSVAMAFIAGVFILYTFWGGQVSVVRTDLWQLVLFVGGVCACLILLVWVPGSPSALWAAVPSSHWSFPVSSSFGWYELLVFYPLIVGLPYLVGPDIYSRVFCARNDKTARQSALFAAAVIVPGSFLLAFLGLAIRAHFPGIAPEAALPVAINELVPAGFRGLIAAGFLAGIMSSADTTLVSASTIVSLNVVSAVARLSKDQQLKLTKGLLVVLGVIAGLIAGLQQGIITSLLLGYTVFVGGVVFPTLASFYRARLRVNANGAMGAVLVGGTTAILGAIERGRYLKAIATPSGDRFLESVLGSHYPAILPILLSIGVLLGVSRLSPRHRW